MFLTSPCEPLPPPGSRCAFKWALVMQALHACALTPLSLLVTSLCLMQTVVFPNSFFFTLSIHLPICLFIVFVLKKPPCRFHSHLSHHLLLRASFSHSISHSFSRSVSHSWLCSQFGGRGHGHSSEGYPVLSGAQSRSAVLFKGCYFYWRRAHCAQCSGAVRSSGQSKALLHPPFWRGQADWSRVLQSLLECRLSRATTRGYCKTRVALVFISDWFI